ncbi:MAG: hypothetical protein ACYS8Z_04925 [Planctomycetota bacterium]|jgi:hypothetical protein
MRIRTRLFLLVFLVSVSTFVCGCSSNSQPSVVGRWKARAISENSSPEAMEVFENGTAVMQAGGDFYLCNHIPKDNIIVYDNEPMAIAILTESTLVLTEQDGDDALVFDRVKN